MKIQDSKTLKFIQREFNDKFPSLRLEFYSEPHKEGEISSKRQPINHEKTVGEVRSIHSEGELSIHPNQKISTLEANFEQNYGLHVQVFRRSGNLWLQTGRTDSWTLAEANRKGEHSRELFHKKYDT